MLALTGGGVVLFGLLGITPGVSPEARATRMLVGSILAIMSVATLWLLRRGHPRVAAGIFMATIYSVLVVGAIWLELGVHSVALPLMACIILIAGFMIGHRAGLAAGVLAMATTLGLFALERLGLISGPTPESAPKAIYITVVYSILFLLVGWLTARYSQLFKKSIADEADARQALAASELQLRTIVDTEPECVKIVSPEGKLLQMNPAGLAMVEADKPEQVVGKYLLNLIAEPFREAFSALHREVMGGHEGRLEFEVIGLKGTHRWLETHAVPMRDASGAITALLGVTRDVTERRRADEERNRQERFLRTIADAVPGVVGYWDADLRNRFANAGYLDWVGLSPEQMLGRPMREVIGDELYQHIEPYIRRVLIGEPQHFEVAATRTDGQRGHGWLHYIPDGSDGKIRGFYVVGWDITELKQMQTALEITNAELRERTEQAEAANLAKSRFLATMSHEIRTPMNGILGMSQLLLTPELNEAERQDYTRVILNSGQTLLTLLNDILDLSKIEAGRVELESLVFRPEQLIREVAALFAEQASAKGLKVEVAWSGSGNVRYRADPVRLRQMMSNLVGNALKFTARGFIRIEGRQADVVANEALLEFSVTDSGIGIPEAQQALLFKRFSQADASTTREYGGTGLGLSIVRDLAKLMGGDAGVDSQAGQGSTFWFRIRAERVKDDDESRQSVRNSHIGTTPMTPTTTSGYVLAVEDNTTNRLVIEALLRRQGIRVECVENGMEAVERITAGVLPDLVLMDCQMPIMDGYEATRRIRQWEQEAGKPRLPIIALTADAFQEDRIRCLAAGMDDFLTKPLHVEDLKATLQKWLGGG